MRKAEMLADSDTRVPATHRQLVGNKTANEGERGRGEQQHRRRRQMMRETNNERGMNEI
jgi:hypothetical protein